MGFTSWLYTNSTKNLRVKIVHPGGHDRPVLAAEILRRNPKCCVAYPDVFKQPWAVVPPETMLMPGQKVYIVPINTVRKPQSQSLRNSPSLIMSQDRLQLPGEQSLNAEEGGNDGGAVSPCWTIMEDNITFPYCLKSIGGEKTKDGSSSHCFGCGMIKSRNLEDSGKEVASSTSIGLSSSEKKNLMMNGKKRDNEVETGGLRAPRKSGGLDFWQPNQHIIDEE